MIHDEIVTYEVAMLAKEKGFNEYVEAFYAEDCNIPHTQGPEKWNEYKGRYAAPTQSLLQRWLREEKGVIIELKYSDDTESFRPFWSWCIYNNLGITIEIGDSSSTYELALEDALKYALENLV